MRQETIVILAIKASIMLIGWPWILKMIQEAQRHIACCFHRYTTAIMIEVSTLLKKEDDTSYFLEVLAEEVNG